MDLLTKLHDRGLTLVMVTHDVHLKSFADRVVWMRDGRIQRIDKNTDAEKAVSSGTAGQEHNIEENFLSMCLGRTKTVGGGVTGGARTQGQADRSQDRAASAGLLRDVARLRQESQTDR